MFDFFDIILGYIRFFFEYLFGLVESLVAAASMLLASLELPRLLSGYLPGLLGAAVLVTTAIAVVRFLLLK